MDLESLESQLPSLSKVEFIGIQDQYSYNEDLACRYLLGGCQAAEGDRIAIYKSGWLYVKDYFLFEWVPIGTNSHVIFNKHCLPRDETEFFQFCYISADNEVLGASTPFQFTATFHEHKYPSDPMENHQTPTSTAGKDDALLELLKLREENDILKETVKLLIGRKVAKNYDRDINELKTMIFGLKDVTNKQAVEINLLKSQVKVCVECNRNLIQEKAEVEQKYRDLQNVVVESGNGETPQSFHLGELESMPPFPFAK